MSTILPSAKATANIGFDFSGTLADDSITVYAASQRLVRELGVTMPSFAEWKSSGCANIAEFIAFYHIPIHPAEYSRRLLKFYTPLCIPYEGIGELLADLSTTCSLTLVSCCWQDILEAELEKLGWAKFFGRVIGGLETKLGVIAKLGFDVYIGDTMGDLRACEGHTRFIPVGYGYSPPEQFIAAGRQDVVGSPKELRARLAEYLPVERTSV